MNLTVASDSIHRHPFTFSTLVIAAVVAIETLLKVTSDLLSVELSVITVGIINGAVLSLLGALVIQRLGSWRQLGLIGRPVRPRTLLWFLPFAIYGVLPLTQGLDITAGKAAAAVAFGVLIASWKLMVLALVLYAWLPRGPRTSFRADRVLLGQHARRRDPHRRHRRTHARALTVLPVPRVRLRGCPAANRPALTDRRLIRAAAGECRGRAEAAANPSSRTPSAGSPSAAAP